MKDMIRVLIADDHAIIRRGIRSMMDTVPDIDVVGEAADGSEAITQSESLAPDVIIMDLVMPGIDGVEAIREIRARNKGARILVLTSFAGDDKVLPAIRAGALGYHLKGSDPDDLPQAIRDVHRNQVTLHPTVAQQVLQEITRPSQEQMAPDPLTPREIEVLRMVAQGRENVEIARQLVISKATVRTHISNILSKLQLNSRTQATLYALREGLTTLEEAYI